MLNKEKYAKEIVELATKGNLIAIDNETKIICSCSDFGECEKCYFYEDNYPYKTENNSNCNTNSEHWANSEYREPKVFTEQERAVIKALDKIEWVAKDDYGDVYGFTHTPVKLNICWALSTGGFVNISETTSCKFESIKSTDTEPTSRAEILGGSEKCKD